eukprot:9063992-Alexandrium_andersonii.AAC.1
MPKPTPAAQPSTAVPAKGRAQAGSAKAGPRTPGVLQRAAAAPPGELPAPPAREQPLAAALAVEPGPAALAQTPATQEPR